MNAKRQPTSTLEFLIARDSSAAKLPTFEPAVPIESARRRVQGAVFVALLAIGLVLVATAAILLR